MNFESVYLRDGWVDSTEVSWADSTEINVPYPEGLSTAKMVQFCYRATVQMRENGIFLVPV